MAKNANPSRHRLTDKEFWNALKATAGMFSRTARYIEKTHGLTGYSRSAVKQRAERTPECIERLTEIREANIDNAEEVMRNILLDKETPALQFQAAKFILQTQGRTRGYVTRVENTGINGEPMKHDIAVMSDRELKDKYEQLLESEKRLLEMVQTKETTDITKENYE